MDRRRFLTLAAALPVLALPWPALAAGRWDRTLVLIELNGGNDGLNTVVPYADPAYQRLRPHLAVARDKVLHLDERLGLHPALEPLMGAWKDGDLGIALGVGYPAPNMSHFRSIEIWETATDSNRYGTEGWVAALLAMADDRRGLAADGAVLGRDTFGPLAGGNLRTVALKDPDAFVRQARQVPEGERARQSNPALDHILAVEADLKRAARTIAEADLGAISLGVTFPPGGLGKQLETVARLMAAGIRIPVLKCSLGSFDTHAGQAGKHAQLLGELAAGLAAFRQALKAKGLWERTLVMTYAEFGRRAAENGSNGTDHGTAAPHFLMGGAVRGGLHGEQPPLDRLVQGNLAYRMHFRSLYAMVAENWWGLRNPYAERPLAALRT